MDPNKSFKYRNQKHRTNSGSAIFGNIGNPYKNTREPMLTNNPLTSKLPTKYDGMQYKFECNNCHGTFITIYWHQNSARHKDVENGKRNQCGCGCRPDWEFLAFKLVSR